MRATISTKLLEFLSSSFLTDFLISCEDGAVLAHRLILSIFMGSESIERFFGAHNVECSILCPYKVEDVRFVLEILYKGDVLDHVLNQNCNAISIMEYFGIDSALIVISNKSLFAEDEHLSTNSIMNSDSDTVDDDDDIEAIVDNEEEEEMNELKKIYKRNPYRRYNELSIDTESIRYQLLHDFAHGSITRISKETGIPKTTLCGWRTKLINDPNFSPVIPNYSNSKQSLDQNVETKLARYIRMTFINKGHLISKKLLLMKCNIYLADEVEKRKNMFSKRWLDGFLKRNNFSFKKVRPKRRPDVSPDSLDSFLKDFAEINETYGPESIYNMDETSWVVNKPPNKTIATKGGDEVRGYINGDIRTAFTVIGTITKSGKKLVPIVLAKGKTHKSINKFGRHEFPVEFIVSKSGWADSDSMEKYLNWLVSQHGSDEFALILDRYPSHLQLLDYIKKTNMKTRLLFIPSGATGILQPLDRMVFGVLKSKGNSKWLTFYLNSGGSSPSLSESLGLLLESWYEINENIILKAWEYQNQYDNDCEPPTDPLDNNYVLPTNDHISE